MIVTSYKKLRSLATAVLLMSSVTATADTTPPPASCGSSARGTVCNAEGSCEVVQVFEVPDAWHGFAQCMRGLRNIWQRRGETTLIDVNDERVGIAQLVERQVLWEMGRSRVRIRDARGDPMSAAELRGKNGRRARRPHAIALLNDIGQPYNAMGQSGVAYFLYQFAVLSGRSTELEAQRSAQLYRVLARATMMAVLTPVNEGGLASTQPCADERLTCTWFHSITRRDRGTSEGATLNQHLHVVRDLAITTEVATKQGWNEAADYRLGFAAGVRQLFLPSKRSGSLQPPDLADFLAPPVGEKDVRWAFYGFNSNARQGYFLGSLGRDCGYHVHSLELLDFIMEHVERSHSQPLRRHVIPQAEACTGSLHRLYRTVIVRGVHKESSAWSSAPALRDFSCPTLEKGMWPSLLHLHGLFAGCE